MTRHNLAGHISWLLSNAITLPVGAREPHHTETIAAAQVFRKDSLEDEAEEDILNEPASPEPSRASIRLERASKTLLRPIVIPKASNYEFTETLRLNSMGKLSSASKSARPALLSQQQQLATPASTTAPSSLTARYAATFPETKNGMVL